MSPPWSSASLPLVLKHQKVSFAAPAVTKMMFFKRLSGVRDVVASLETCLGWKAQNVLSRSPFNARENYEDSMAMVQDANGFPSIWMN